MCKVKEDMIKRLNILAENSVISKKVRDTTEKAFMYVLCRIKSPNYSASEKFVTHMAMALQRIESGEKIEMVNKTIIEEIQNNENYEKTKLFLENLKNYLGIQLREEEEVYILIHLFNILYMEGENNEDCHWRATR